MISLRTKDDVTLAASRRLFAAAGTPAELASLDEEEIARLIYPAGFYRMKAGNIREVARTVARQGTVPDTLELLTALPGVGRKTANLVLNLGFGIPAICVDTHVHRIANRLGWIATRTPDETERALMALMPARHWIETNELLVAFGQQVCTPVSPRCSACPFRGPGDDRRSGARPICRRVGVTKSR